MVFVLHGIPLTNTCNHSLSTHYMFALLVASLLVPWVWKYASVQQAETARRYASPSKMRRDYARMAQFIERKRLNAQSVCSAVAVSDAVADTTESIPSEEEPSESSSLHGEPTLLIMLAMMSDGWVAVCQTRLA